MVANTLGDASSVLPLIDGATCASQSEDTVNVVNPSNGRSLLSIPAGCIADADHAVASARRAFEDGRWSEAPPIFKKRTLHRFADLIAAEAALLDALDAGEMGKPVSLEFGSAMSAASLMRFYAEALDKRGGEVYASDKTSFVVQRKVPRGVVAAITPWNFPTMNAIRKLAPALAAGNSVVLKPSELSSRSAMRLARLAVEAGLPPGVLNAIPGVGETVGRALALHNDVDMITFTGSTEVGKTILQHAGHSNMKRVIAECGGKSPQIVFDDRIDLSVASESIATSMLTNQGQVCTVGSRLLVQRSIEAALVEKIVARFGLVVTGDALDPKTTFGPVASARQCSRIMQYIAGAKQDGAQLVIGGGRAREDSGGYFVQPTIFRNVTPTAKIAQEEIFGPVLCVIPFRDEQEAIAIANRTMYGLMGYVWTTDLSRAMRMAKAIRSSVRINAAGTVGDGAGHAASFEAARQSGIGIETGVGGMESYMRRQVVWITHA